MHAVSQGLSGLAHGGGKQSLASASSGSIVSYCGKQIGYDLAGCFVS